MNFPELIVQFPPKVSGGYDAMVVAFAEFDRVVGASSPRVGLTWGNVAVKPSRILPEGYALLMKGTTVVGVVDYKNGKATVTLVPEYSCAWSLPVL